MKKKFLPLWLLMVLSLLASAEAYAKPWLPCGAWRKPMGRHLTINNIDMVVGLSLTAVTLGVLTLEAHRAYYLGMTRFLVSSPRK